MIHAILLTLLAIVALLATCIVFGVFCVLIGRCCEIGFELGSKIFGGD